MGKLANKIKLKIQSFFKERTTDVSYGQFGEDSIIILMLNLYKIKNANFIDIGAHHPYKYSNTALLYANGINGINIEPDPELFKEFAKYRKKDVNLNIGVHEEVGESVLYQFEKPEFNTFSKETANSIVENEIKKVGETKIRINTFNAIVNKYLNGKAPDIIFLDAEGLDEIIIKSINFKKYAPKIICVETYAYGVGIKNYKIIEFVKSKGYTIHADTFVNTIFIKNEFVNGLLK